MNISYIQLSSFFIWNNILAFLKRKKIGHTRTLQSKPNPNQRNLESIRHETTHRKKKKLGRPKLSWATFEENQVTRTNSGFLNMIHHILILAQSQKLQPIFFYCVTNDPQKILIWLTRKKMANCRKWYFNHAFSAHGFLQIDASVINLNYAWILCIYSSFQNYSKLFL